MLQPRVLFEIDRQKEIPSEKITGVLIVFDQVLDTQGEEAKNILASMRGRKGRNRVLTFGELLGLADGETINNAAKEIGITDLGAGPTVTLARILRLIADPLIPICESCNRYAVSDEGGIHDLLYKEGTRCPFKGCGALLTAPKQEQSFIAWTTLQDQKPAATHDRISIPHQPLPLRNDIILAQQKHDGMYYIHQWLERALREVGLLTEEGQVNAAHFLMFLAHSSLKGRFMGGDGKVQLDRVLVALKEPSLYGAWDEMSVRAVVRDAKDWKVPSVTSRVIEKKSDSKVSAVDSSKPTIFVLCAPKDKGALEDLRTQLARRVNILSDDSIPPGGDVEKERRILIEKSDGIVLMLSAYSAAIGLDEEAHHLAKSGKRCMPMLVSSYHYPSSAVGYMQCMNEMKPVKSDEDWMKVKQEIRCVFNIP